ncbi:glycine cleavage system H protein, mitochondrial-like [Saccoglossus kowalevskii]
MASLVRLGLRRVASTGTRYIAATQLVPRHVPHSARYCSQESEIRDDRKYSDKHEWIKLDGEVGTIGVSDYAQESLGDVVYVGLPEVNAEIEKDDEFGAVESWIIKVKLSSPEETTELMDAKQYGAFLKESEQ